MGSKWREAHGGFFHTVGKPTGFMVLVLFGSFFSEIVSIIAFRSVPYGVFEGAFRMRCGLRCSHSQRSLDQNGSSCLGDKTRSWAV